MASKHWNAASCGPEDERHQVCKLDFPSKKRLFLIFFNYKEPFTVDVSAEKSTITGIYNIETVLPQVFWKMEYQRSTMGTQNVLIHWDSGSLHTKKGSSSVPWLTRSLNLPFLPYSTDLTPCDFWLFHLLKDRLAAHVCRTSAKLYVQSWEVFPQSDCHRAFRAEKYSLEVTITEPSELRSILPKWLSQSLRWFVETFAITHTVQGRMLWKNVLLPWTCDQLFLFISLLSLFLNISDVDDVMVVIIDWTLLLIKVMRRRRG